MPFTYHIDSEAGILFVVGEGEITQAERLETMRAWLKDKAYRPGLPTLCDFSAASSTPSLPELRTIVDFIEQHAASIGPKKVAMVTAKPSTFGVARQFQALVDSGPVQAKVFTDRVAALAWLCEGNH